MQGSLDNEVVASARIAMTVLVGCWMSTGIRLLVAMEGVTVELVKIGEVMGLLSVMVTSDSEAVGT